jgi:hypothetical protein
MRQQFLQAPELWESTDITITAANFAAKRHIPQAGDCSCGAAKA